MILVERRQAGECLELVCSPPLAARIEGAAHHRAVTLSRHRRNVIAGRAVAKPQFRGGAHRFDPFFFGPTPVLCGPSTSRRKRSSSLF
jgi:hypothetical protein